MRFFLLDKVLEILPGKSAKGVKCWSLDNEIFEDHFPGYPTTPGVLLTESMAQLAGLLIEHSFYQEYGKPNRVFPILSIIQKAKFRTFVSPGDQCIIEATMMSLDTGRGTCQVITRVNNEMVCEATLSFVILGKETGMEENKFLAKRDQYLSNILPPEFK
jgi:3-hydroxyacyl-[acyl-carrier-protein] dehydratase